MGGQEQEREVPQAHAGLTLIEMAVVLAIILIIASIGLTVYDQFMIKSRDDQRDIDLHRFAQLLELFKNQHGYYVCGDACQEYPAGSGTYVSIDCSDELGTIEGDDTGGDNSLEISGFLNGGDCCIAQGGFPGENNVNATSTWGIYRSKYIDTSCLLDPLNAQVPSGNYFYCYATLAKGRGAYALFARMERGSSWFTMKTQNYPDNGWTPESRTWNVTNRICKTGFPPVCGDGYCNGDETCNSCEYDCGHCCGNGICETQFGESCSTCDTDCYCPPQPPCPSNQICPN